MEAGYLVAPQVAHVRCFDVLQFVRGVPAIDAERNVPLSLWSLINTGNTLAYVLSRDAFP